MLAYAVLRLRGHDRTRAAALVLRYRPQAQLVPAWDGGQGLGLCTLLP